MDHTSRSTNALGPLPKLLTIDQVADTLGVTVRHVRRLVFERRIPYVKWGHLLRFEPDDLQRWLEEARVHERACEASLRARPQRSA